MATSFSKDIRPYFTACFRAHMITFGSFDLWLQADVQSHWQRIFDKVQEESMPASGCPEGEWDGLTREQFLKDFQSWKDGNFTE